MRVDTKVNVKGIRVSFLETTVMHQSIPTVPIPPPQEADPQELEFFENKLANAPPPGQNSCSNAPGWWLKHVKNVLFSSFLVLL